MNLRSKYMRQLKINAKNSHSIRKSSDELDNTYIDITINYNDSDPITQAVYNEMRTESIIDNPSEYYLSIIRFKIPGSVIPILVMPVDPTGSNTSVYSVTLSYNGDVQKQNLIYYSALNFATVSDNYYYYVFEFQHLLFMINVALDTAFSNLSSPPVGSEAPYMIFDPATNLFSFIAQTANYNSGINPSTTDTGYIQVYFNFKLANLFTGIPFKVQQDAFNSGFSSDGRDEQMIITSYGNNNDNLYRPNPTASYDYFQIQQELPSLSNFNPFNKIVVTSNTLPVSPSYSQSGDSYRKVVTDFQPEITLGSDIRTQYLYIPQSQYRLIDLLSDRPIYNIDLTFYWEDANNTLHRIFIPWGEEINMTIGFFKKYLYRANQLSMIK